MKQVWDAKASYAEAALQEMVATCQRKHLLQFPFMFSSSLFGPLSTRFMIISSQTQAVLCMMEYDHLKTNFLDLAHQDFWFSHLK